MNWRGHDPLSGGMFRRVEGSGIKRMSSGGEWHQEDVEWGGVAPRGCRVGGSGTKRMSSGGEWHQEDVEWGGVTSRGCRVEGQWHQEDIEWGGVAPRGSQVRESGTKRRSISSSGGEWHQEEERGACRRTSNVQSVQPWEAFRMRIKKSISCALQLVPYR